MNIGQINTLKIQRQTDHGFYLVDENGEEVLLPNNYIDESMSIDDDVEVFLFNDSEDRLTATTEFPKLTLGEFAYLKVVDVHKYGAFVDWGLPKDLLVPFAEQNAILEEGFYYPIYLRLDELTQRLIGSNKINKYLNFEHITLELNEKVLVLPYAKNELGISCIINNEYRGLVFNSDIHKEVKLGHTITAYVKEVREDGKIDLSLEPIGYKASIDPASEKIIDKLKTTNSFLPFHDKSDPEEIKSFFGLSKKAFKRALGNLYKQKLILIEEDGIRLIED